MIKKSVVLILGFMLIFGVTFTSAAWYNPISWFGGGGTVNLSNLTGPGNISSGFTYISTETGIMLKIHQEYNAHGEEPNGVGNYTVKIKYTDIFGLPDYILQHNYDPESISLPIMLDNKCTGSNVILRLSDTTNAHAEKPGYRSVNYHDICFGDVMGCRYTTGNCASNERCVVTLFSETNSHIAKCGIAGSYDNKICCTTQRGVGGAVPPTQGACNTYTTRADCWYYAQQNCTWTPQYVIVNNNRTPTISNPNGGCCAKGQKWRDGVCIGTDITTCNFPFTDTIAYGLKSNPMNTIAGIGGNLFTSGGPLDKVSTPKKYCSQVTSGVDLGYWENVNLYP